MPETKNRTFDEVARDLAFGTIVVGKRTAALQAPVFTKEDDEAATALRDDDEVKAWETPSFEIVFNRPCPPPPPLLRTKAFLSPV